jgi:hypothetical protein
MSDKKQEEKPKRVNRFIYSDDDVNHIFKLGKIGGVFNEDTTDTKSDILLKNLISVQKK